MISQHDFGNNLRSKRQELKIKQKDLAQTVGISAQSLGLYEKGVKFPPFETVIALAQALGVSLDWLTGLTTEEMAGSGGHLKTKGDAARAIVQLLGVAEVSLSYVDVLSEFGDVRDCDKKHHVPGITFHGSMKDFSEGLLKFQELQKSNLLSPDLASAAIDGICQKLDSENASDYEDALPF